MTLPQNVQRLWGRNLSLTLVALNGASFSETDPGANVITINGGDNPQGPGLRVQFKISKTREKTPNASEIKITNLAPSHRSALQAKWVRATLQAGYNATGLSQIYTGDARTIDHAREGSDWLTTLKCGDAENALRLAFASKSFAAGCTVGDVVRACADALALPLGNTVTEAAKLSKVLYQGATVHGPAQSELDRILRAVGYRWSVQDGQLQILGNGESVANSVPVISVETGLIGSPELGSPEAKGKRALLKFKCLLNPAVRAGGRVQLISEHYNGIFAVKRLEHTGDTHGGEWYTSIEGIPDATATAA